MYISILKNKYHLGDVPTRVFEIPHLNPYDIETKKEKQKSPLFNLTNSPRRTLHKYDKCLISGFIIDYDHPELPKLKDSYSYYYHKTHRDRYHIIVPFDKDYTYSEEWDTSANFIGVLNDFFVDNVFDMLGKNILQKDCCHFKRYCHFMPSRHDLVYVENNSLFKLPFFATSKKTSSHHIRNFSIGKNLENYPDKFPYLFNRCYWFMRTYKFDIDWTPIDTKGKCIFDWHTGEKSGSLFNNTYGTIPANIHCKHATCEDKLNVEFAMLYDLASTMCEKIKMKIPPLSKFNRTIRYIIVGIIKGNMTGWSIRLIESCAFYLDDYIYSQFLLFAHLDLVAETDVGVWSKISYSNLVFNPQNTQYYFYKDGYYQKISHEVIRNQMIGLCGRYFTYRTFGKSGLPYAKSIASFILEKTLQDFKKLSQNDHTNVLNGIILLDTKTPSCTFLPHTPTLFSTEQKKIVYDPHKKSDLWLKSLNRYFPKADQKMYINVLQEFFGYCLTYDRSLDKFLLIFGVSNSGKSTMSEVIIDLLNAGESNLKALLDVDNRTTACEGKTALILEEVEAVKYSNTREFIKKATSKSSIVMRFKTKNSYSSKRFPKMIFTSNSFPEAFDIDQALKRRILLVPLTNALKPSEVDIDMNKKLKSQDNVSGIFNWALEGFMSLYNKKVFTNNDELVNEYYRAANPSLFMLKEFLIGYANDMVEHEKWVKSSMLYKEFLEKHGHDLDQPMSIVKFGNNMKHLGVPKKISQGARYFMSKNGMFNKQF